ncbi:hypothetical protein HZS_4347 [Henneguya salminicola]|nr:hypothetical protein HZS_4347 [Henneguya salminicola]
MVPFIKRSTIQNSLLQLKEFILIISKVNGMLLNFPFHELAHRSIYMYDGYFEEYTFRRNSQINALIAPIRESIDENEDGAVLKKQYRKELSMFNETFLILHSHINR